MPRRCTICAHPERDALEREILYGVPYRKIAQRYGVSDASITRHVHSHMATLEQQRQARLDALKSEVAELIVAAKAAIANARNVRDWAVVAREYRSTLELLLKIEGAFEVRNSDDVIIIQNPREY